MHQHFLLLLLTRRLVSSLGQIYVIHFGTSSQIQRSGHVTLIKQISTFKLMLISTCS